MLTPQTAVAFNLQYLPLPSTYLAPHCVATRSHLVPMSYLSDLKHWPDSLSGLARF
jgi:hypothetical protein